MAGQTRVGVGNRLSTKLAPNLSVTLSAGYDSFFFAEDPLQNYRALQQRIATTWGRQGGWQFGVSASSSSEWSIYEERRVIRSEEHTSELQSLMRSSYAVFRLKKKKKHTTSS